jgi:dephospho-CoA kinase
MRLIGLTGGVGMGKSTAAGLLRDRGVAVIDTDLIAREIVEPGQPALDEIKKSFGDSIIGSDGRLRRSSLAELVFSDVAARRQLEAILHPRIRGHWLAQVESWRAEKRSLAVVVIPLLFETKAENLFDATICVACSSATQRERLAARGWESTQIDQRNEAQWPVEKKISISDYVVWTEGILEIHAEQLRRLLG